MSYKAILFDLDGTLLPMDFDVFTKGYFKELTKVLCPLGLSPENVVSAVWGGTKDMVKNDGSKTNCDVFWDSFAKITGLKYDEFKEKSDAFYTREFNNARACTGENPLALDAVRAARKKADKVILATNPLFPMDGQHTRLSWIGISPAEFDLITSYEGERYCKPNPKYYLSICERMGVSPSECLMIGNDIEEDAIAASAAGMDVYIVDDCLIPSKLGREWNGKRGSFTEMLEMLNNL